MSAGVNQLAQSRYAEGRVNSGATALVSLRFSLIQLTLAQGGCHAEHQVYAVLARQAHKAIKRVVLILWKDRAEVAAAGTGVQEEHAVYAVSTREKGMRERRGVPRIAALGGVRQYDERVNQMNRPKNKKPRC